MKVNLHVRFKNLWFWVGILGVILSAMNINPETLTSWQSVWDAFAGLLGNPYQIGAVFIAILGVFIDPTTNGLSDSTQVMGYNKPRKE